MKKMFFYLILLLLISQKDVLVAQQTNVPLVGNEENLLNLIGKNVYINELKGGSIAIDSILQVRDDRMLANNTLSPDVDLNMETVDVIVFELDVNKTFDEKIPFNATVILSITLIDSLGTQSNETVELNLNYDTSNVEQNRKDVYVCENGHLIMAQILSVELSEPTAVNVLVLRNEIHAVRSLVFDCESVVTDLIATGDAIHQELTISWTPINGATHYELEWLFIDKYSDLYTNYASLAGIDQLFRNDASRVTIKDASYIVRLGYPEGRIVYRVRPVEYVDPFHVHHGQWTNDILDNYTWSGLEENKNWTYQAVYVEDGKRNVEVSYFDGLNRSRQSSTLNESNEASLVSNSYYNREGQLAATSLPAPFKEGPIGQSNPLNGRSISYYPNFNLDANNDEFNWEDLSTNVCDLNGAAMSDQSGAGRYYSQASDFVTDFHKYTPQAGGFPYVQKIYLNDNTGRVAIEAGVGAYHNILYDIDHTTRYFYGKPSQEELYRLFGLDVGFENYYNKEGVRDPNGQISFTYKDGQDRIIATSLAGASPENLLPLSSNVNQEPLTVSLIRKQMVGADKIELDYFVLVPTPGEYNFDYSVLTTPSTDLGECLPDNRICYNCKYDIKIVVRSECDELFSKSYKNYTLATWDTVCGDTYSSVNDQFSINFENVGTYTIHKEVTLNKEMQEQYLSDYLDRAACKDFGDFLNEAIAALDFSGCNITCEECFDKLGSQEDFLADAESEVTSSGGNWSELESSYVEAYEQLKSNCAQLCQPDTTTSCAAIYETMLNDFAPGGQYFNFTEDQNGVITSSDLTSIIYSPIGGIPMYKNPNLVYTDKDGNPALVEIDGVNYAPQDLNPTEFYDKFDYEWLKTLVTLHPEYCEYEFCIDNVLSYQFDQYLRSIKSFDDAVAEQIIDLDGNFICDDGTSSPKQDPFFLADPTRVSCLNGLMNEGTFPSGCSNTGQITSVQLAVMYINNKDYCNTNNCPPGYDLDACLLSPINYNQPCSTYCEKDRNFIWQFIRNRYIELKTVKYKDIAINRCTLNPVWHRIQAIGLSDPELVKSGFGCNANTSHQAYQSKVPRFTILPPCTLNFPTSPPQAITNYTNTATSICEGYIPSWTNILENCSNPTPTQIDDIIEGFLEICVAGYDLNHPYGSSNLPPGVPGQYQDFQAVLDAHLPPASCSSLLFTMPPSYNQEPPIHGMVYDEVPECVCDELQLLLTQFEQFAGVTYEPSLKLNFSNYLSRIKSIEIKPDDLHALIAMCDGADCSGLSEPFMLPQALACPRCFSCTEVQNAIDAFNTDPANSGFIGQSAYALVLSNYLNKQFGFFYTMEEYYDFISKCNENSTMTDCDRVKLAYAEWESDPNINSKYPLALYLNMITGLGKSIQDWLLYFSDCSPVGYDPNNPVNLIPFNNPPTSCDLLKAAVDAYWNTSGVNTGLNWESDMKSFILTNYWNVGNWSNLLQNCSTFKDLTIAPGNTCNYLAQLKNDVQSAYPPIINEYNAFLEKVHLLVFPNFSINYAVNAINFCNLQFTSPNCSTLLPIMNAWFNNLQSNEDFATFANTYTSWNFPAASYESWMAECYTSFNGKLCYKDLLPEVKNDTDDCYEQLLSFAEGNAINAWENYIQGLEADFYAGYISPCINSLQELFNMTYTPSEYHYTLYYYDRAGNLLKTVPPKGVKPFDNVTVQTLINDPSQIADPYPDHDYVSSYQYNTLNKVVEQYSPDAGKSVFWYDDLGRIYLSQNQEQHGGDFYSYSRYDNLSRIIEVGKVFITQSNFSSFSNYSSFNTNIATNMCPKTEVVRTYYDENIFSSFTLENLNMRVASTTYSPGTPVDENDYLTATHYTYDISGNVASVYQENKSIACAYFDQSIKEIKYQYDLISGKVNKVIFQPDQPDQFIHSYFYDADNRLKMVKTSNNDVAFTDEANYTYYLHGPLARTLLGQNNVQGLDYAYTIQGWLKGVNSSLRQPWREMGRDGWVPPAGSGLTSPNELVGRDVFSFTLSYFDDDYRPVGGAAIHPEISEGGNTWITNYAGSLYNGNIRNMTVDLELSEFPAMGTAYRYDQLNRLVGTQTMFNPNYQRWEWDVNSIRTQAYEEPEITYDDNGNIYTYKRNDETGQIMDDLLYSYHAPHIVNAHSFNRLEYVTDNTTTAFAGDLESQQAMNYTYDAIGNLVGDVSEQQQYFWNNFGKLDSVYSGSSRTALKFIYDPMGNRVEKRYYDDVSTPDIRLITYYVRDAQGNPLATYERKQDYTTLATVDHYSLKDWITYGSARLGSAWPREGLLGASPDLNVTWTRPITQLREGQRQYELTNHLGNVLATISDMKQYVDTTSGGSTWQYTKPYLLNIQDYYPFGMLMPGRSLGSGDYRFGFNGQERTDEIAGTGNHTTALYWEYDTRLGRRWNVDPVDQISNSNYSAFTNNPIYCIDPLGNTATKYEDENGKEIGNTNDGNQGTVTISNANKEAFLKEYQNKESQGTNNSIIHNESWIRRYGESMTLLPGQKTTNWALDAISPASSNELSKSQYAAKREDGFSISPIGPTLIVLGAPIVPKVGGLAGGGSAGKWTSIASKSLRWTDKMIQRRLGTSIKLPANNLLTRFLGTRGVGAAVGRAVPYIGWYWTAMEVGWESGKEYGPSKWLGNDDSKYLE